MKRYPIFDPPEYVAWTSDPAILEEYEQTIQRDRQRAQIISQLEPEKLLGMYAGLLRFRLHDITLRRWVSQGILAKAWLGTGEEAVTVGNVHALNREIDKVGPMIRNAGACHEMGMPVETHIDAVRVPELVEGRIEIQVHAAADAADQA